MKRMMIALTCMAVVFVMAGIGFADTWPTKTTGLLKILSAGDNYCALFTLGKGSIEIDCAKKVGEEYTDQRAYTCAPSATNQICTTSAAGWPSTITVKTNDIYSVKCSKVCSGSPYR